MSDHKCPLTRRSAAEDVRRIQGVFRTRVQVEAQLPTFPRTGMGTKKRKDKTDHTARLKSIDIHGDRFNGALSVRSFTQPPRDRPLYVPQWGRWSRCCRRTMARRTSGGARRRRCVAVLRPKALNAAPRTHSGSSPCSRRRTRVRRWWRWDPAPSERLWRPSAPPLRCAAPSERRGSLLRRCVGSTDLRRP
jgi:hypothetical protein